MSSPFSPKQTLPIDHDSAPARFINDLKEAALKLHSLKTSAKLEWHTLYNKLASMTLPELALAAENEDAPALEVMIAKSLLQTMEKGDLKGLRTHYQIMTGSLITEQMDITVRAQIHNQTVNIASPEVIAQRLELIDSMIKEKEKSKEEKTAKDAFHTLTQNSKTSPFNQLEHPSEQSPSTPPKEDV